MELGPEDVSLLERCPHFRGWYVQASHCYKLRLLTVLISGVDCLPTKLVRASKIPIEHCLYRDGDRLMDECVVCSSLVSDP